MILGTRLWSWPRKRLELLTTILLLVFVCTSAFKHIIYCLHDPSNSCVHFDNYVPGRWWSVFQIRLTNDQKGVGKPTKKWNQHNSLSFVKQNWDKHTCQCQSLTPHILSGTWDQVLVFEAFSKAVLFVRINILWVLLFLKHPPRNKEEHSLIFKTE